MRKLLALLLTLSLLGACLPMAAAEGHVTYSGNAGDIVFEPGSEYSATDLFPDFKDMMPGDTLTDTITVHNKADKAVKVKIYMRALGAHEDSEAFLSQLHLQVKKSADNVMGYMFDAAAHETAGLTDWVCLGMLYSGGKVDLDVTLTVPVTLPDAYSDQIGYLDWEFMVEEFPVEEGDPQAPSTGDPVAVVLTATAAVSAGILILAVYFRRKKQRVNTLRP